jgi:4-oxalmesaconate hydratase
MLGGVTTIDPQTGRFFDDNKPCLDGIPWLGEQDRRKIFEDNAKKAYPRLGPLVDARRGARVDSAR